MSELEIELREQIAEYRRQQDDLEDKIEELFWRIDKIREEEQ